MALPQDNNSDTSSKEDRSKDKDDTTPEASPRKPIKKKDKKRRHKSCDMGYEDKKPPAKRSRSELEDEILALKEQLSQMQEMMASKPAAKSSKPASAGAKASGRSGRVGLGPKLKSVFNDAIKDVVWSKSPILHSEVDRQKFAKAAAKATTLDDHSSKNPNCEANLANLVALHAQSISSLLNKNQAGCVVNMKKKVSVFLEAKEDNVIPKLEDLEKVVAHIPSAKKRCSSGGGTWFCRVL